MCGWYEPHYLLSWSQVGEEHWQWFQHLVCIHTLLNPLFNIVATLLTVPRAPSPEGPPLFPSYLRESGPSCLPGRRRRECWFFAFPTSVSGLLGKILLSCFPASNVLLLLFPLRLAHLFVFFVCFVRVSEEMCRFNLPSLGGGSTCLYWAPAWTRLCCNSREYTDILLVM